MEGTRQPTRRAPRREHVLIAPEDGPGRARPAPEIAAGGAGRRRQIVRPAVLLALALTLTFVMRWPSLDLPLDRDEGEYATVAQRVLRNDGLPYRDYLLQKPPAVPALYAAALWVGGEVPASIRWLALVWTFATACAIRWLLGTRFEAPRAGSWAAALFVLATAGPRLQGIGANTELFVTLPTVIALGIAATRGVPYRPLRWLVAGVLAGVAGLMKQPALLVAPLLPLLADRPTRTGIRAAAWTATGVALPWALVSALLASRGALSDFLSNCITYNLAYASSGAAGVLGRVTWVGGRIAPELAVLTVMAIAALVRRPPARRLEVLTFGGWLGAAALGACVSGRFYPHYFLPVVAPVACLAAMWLVAPSSGRSRARRAADHWTRAAAVAAAVVAFAAGAAPLWTAGSGGERSEAVFGLTNFARAPEAAALIARLDPSGGHLWIWGAEAELFFLSGRRPATRFLYHYPMTGEAPPYPRGPEELLAGLTDPRTSAVVVAAPLRTDDPLHARILAALRAGFTPIGEVGPFRLGVRAGTPAKVDATTVVR